MSGRKKYVFCRKKYIFPSGKYINQAGKYVFLPLIYVNRGESYVFHRVNHLFLPEKQLNHLFIKVTS